MASRRFEYEGISMRRMSVTDCTVEYGGVPMIFDILVREIGSDGLSLDEENVFSVGTIEVTRISDYVLSLAQRSRETVLDLTSGTYLWGRYTEEDCEAFWDMQFPESGGGMLDSIRDFIGIESVYIDPQFRGKGLMGQALKSMASVIGFGPGSMLLLMANPWMHSNQKNNDVDNPEYQRDMSTLVSSYQKVGFRELCWDGQAVFMALSADYKNKAWERLWTKNTAKPVKLKAFNKVERLMLDWAE